MAEGKDNFMYNNIQGYLDLFEFHPADPQGPNDKALEGYWSFKLDVIVDSNSKYQELSDMMQKSELDMDSKYNFTVEALEAMKEILSGNDIKANIDDETTLLVDQEVVEKYAEPPIYNNEILEWFAKGTNYAFVDEVISENGDLSSNISIIDIIQIAYTKAWTEHYFEVLEVIKFDMDNLPF